MSENNKKRNEIIKTMMEIECYSAGSEEHAAISKYKKLPLSRIAAYGTAFEPLVSAFQFVVSGGKVNSGLCMVTVPKGGHLAKFKDGSGSLGTVLDSSNQISGQARINPLVCNPTMIFVAASLASIDKKLDSIQEIQQELMDFLVQKERSELKGNLNFLMDVLNNYKYNWDNDKYKNNSHIKVLDIKQAAEQKIDMYREQIDSNIEVKTFLHSDQTVKKQIEKIDTVFKDYQLALYSFAFASFLEVMLLENFEAAFLQSVSRKISEYSFRYRELYTRCYDQIADYSNSSVQSHILGGLSRVNTFAGKTIEKIPIVSKSQLD